MSSLAEQIIPEGGGAPEGAGEEAVEAAVETPTPTETVALDVEVYGDESFGDPPADTVEEPEAVEEPAATPDPWGSLRDEYGNLIDQYQGDPAKIVKALADAKAHISRGLQPEPVAEQYEQEMLANERIRSVPGIWPPSSVQELYDAAIESPEAAAEAGVWVLQNKHLVPQEAVDNVLTHWFSVKPMQAMAYVNQAMFREHQAAMEQRIQAERSQWEPIVQDAKQTVIMTAVDLAKEGIGAAEFEKYRPQIADLLDTVFKQQSEAAKSPTEAAQVIDDAYAFLKGREWRMRRGASTPTPAANGDSTSETPSEKPRDAAGRFAATSTTGSAASPDRSSKAIADAIIGVD